MIPPEIRIRCYLLDDFKDASKAILLAGERDELDALQESMLALGKGQRAAIALRDINDPPRMIINCSVLSSKNAGLRLCGEKNKTHVVNWSVPKSEWLAFAELVRALTDSPGPGHNYLETKGDEALVVVSHGEYPANYRFKT